MGGSRPSVGVRASWRSWTGAGRIVAEGVASQVCAPVSRWVSVSEQSKLGGGQAEGTAGGACGMVSMGVGEGTLVARPCGPRGR